MSTDKTAKVAHYRDGGSGRSKAQKRLLIWRRQGGKCAICGLPIAVRDATLDHLIPRSKGGPNTYANLRVAHQTCNSRRGADVSDIFVVTAGIRALRWHVKELA